MTALDERPATHTAAGPVPAAVPSARGPWDDQMALFDDEPWRVPDAWIEDVEWMVDTGETLPGIALRLGITEDSVVRELQPDRFDRPDLLERLARRDSTVLSTGLPVLRRDLGKVGGTLDVPIPAGQAAAVRALVARRCPPGAARTVLAALGIGPIAGRT